MFIIKGPQQNSKKWYISKSSKNMLTATASNRFSSMLYVFMLLKSDDKFVTHPQYEMGQFNTDHISTRFCRRVSALLYIVLNRN